MPPRSPARIAFGPILLATLLSLGGSSARTAEPHPIAAPGNFELHPDLQIQLFAREPAIVDPVALTFDTQGRMYVVEMRDYPYGIGSDHKPGGTIRLLEDLDGDGRADRSTVFADGLSFPTSIAPWKDGVIVTAPPEVIFLQDTNGDGKADVREVLLRGFTLGVTDSNVNGLRWGLDNRLHGVNGGNGGNIFSLRRPGQPLPLRNLDFSFDPGTGDLTATAQTSGGFGLVFDDWGRSFVTYNINHLQQRIIPVRYLHRFPGLPPVETTVSISDHEEMARIYPVSEAETRVNHPEQSGHFSSAGGMGLVGWPGYPGDLPGSVFVCDVVGNLVHRDLLVPSGPIFVARRAPSEQNREFFGSRDPAFRPVGLELGPDGALYLIDMQRDVIEHPDYIPQKVKERLNLRAGEDRGRIYRITPSRGLPMFHPGRTTPGSAAASGGRGTLPSSIPLGSWVRLLGDSNQWWRTTAQRLLVERQDPASIPLVRALLREPNPQARLHALWTLLGLGALDGASVEAALADEHPGVRENALQLAERFLPGTPGLRRRVLDQIDDPEIRVRFQAALTVGQIDSSEAGAGLQRLFFRDYSQRWTRLAVLSSWRYSGPDFLSAALSRDPFRSGSDPAAQDAIRDLADLVGARATSSEDVIRLLQAWTASAAAIPARIATLDGLRTGLGRADLKISAPDRVEAALQAFVRPANPGLFAAAWQLGRSLGLPGTVEQKAAVRRAAQEVLEPGRTSEQRRADIQILGLGTYAESGAALLALIGTGQGAEMREPALLALAGFKDRGLAEDLIGHWRSLAPAVRPQVVQLLLSRVPWHDVLLRALEEDRIRVGELNLDLEQRRRLLRKSTPEVMTRAARLLGDEEYSNRKKVVMDWLAKLPRQGEAARGRLAFAKTCSPCHALDGVGNAVGPDLGALVHRSVEDLLSNILDPNMAINPGYISFTAETVAGEIESGILQAESADSVVLLQAAGRKLVLPRQQLKRLESSGLSLMPEGLEAGMTPQDLRDLIAFLQAKR